MGQKNTDKEAFANTKMKKQGISYRLHRQRKGEDHRRNGVCLKGRLDEEVHALKVQSA